MAKIKTVNEQKQKEDDVFDSSKTAFKTIAEENISKTMIKGSNTETAEKEDLEGILNSPKLLTKGKKINLSYLDKDTREVFKEAIEAEYRKLFEVFETLLESPNVSQDELINKMRSQCESMVARHPEMNIKFTKDGSINLTTIKKRFRLRYRELEAMRKEKYKVELKRRLNNNPNLTPEEIAEMRKQGKSMKDPFKGKFKQ